MNLDVLSELYAKMDALRVAGKEEEAKAVFQSALRAMPEDVQAEVLLSLVNSAVEEEVEGLQAVRDIQARGLALAEELEKEEAKG